MLIVPELSYLVHYRSLNIAIIHTYFFLKKFIDVSTTYLTTNTHTHTHTHTHTTHTPCVPCTHTQHTHNKLA